MDRPTDFLTGLPDAEYGTFLPFARNRVPTLRPPPGSIEYDPSTGAPYSTYAPLSDTRPAMPEALRSGLMGINDLAMGTQTGKLTPEALASITLGSLGVGGMMAPRGALASGGAFKAYHGSPHDFDRFDLSKIGTGEGAQAYGHGLYFADNPKVADLYSRVVTSNQPGWSGTVPPAFNNLPASELAKIPDELRGRLVASWQNNGEETAKIAARKMFEDNRGAPYSDALHSLAYTEWKAPGHRYEVNIHADPARFLDWDNGGRKTYEGMAKDIERRNMSDLEWQRNNIIAKYNDNGSLIAARTKMTPEDRAKEAEISNALTSLLGSGQQQASDIFARQGIPGIRYLDQGSRTAGEGSRNTVVFNPDIIEILRKYGLAAPSPIVPGMNVRPSQQAAFDPTSRDSAYYGDPGFNVMPPPPPLPPGFRVMPREGAY